jgi:hypothetical protein
LESQRFNYNEVFTGDVTTWLNSMKAKLFSIHMKNVIFKTRAIIPSLII